MRSAGVTAAIKATHLITLSNQTDRFYALPPLFMWAAAEDALAIIAATIPTLRPLLGNKQRNTPLSYELRNVGSDNANEMFYPRARRTALTTTVEAELKGFDERHDYQSDTSILQETEQDRDIESGRIHGTTQVLVTSSRG